MEESVEGCGEEWESRIIFGDSADPPPERLQRSPSELSEAGAEQRQEAVSIEDGGAKNGGQRVPKTGNMTLQTFVDNVSGFTDHQKEFLRDNGFGFVVGLEAFKAPLRVVCWLLMNWDPEKSMFKLDDGREISVTEQDFVEILGLRRGDLVPSPEDSKKIRSKLKNLAKKHPTQHRYEPCMTVEEARHVLETMKGMNNMTVDEKRVFLSAVVIVTVTEILSPRKFRSSVPSEVAAAIEDPAGPAGYNWAEYGLRMLNEDAISFKKNMLKMEVARNSSNLDSIEFAKSMKIPGCSLFLAYLYAYKCTGNAVAHKPEDLPLVSKVPYDEIYKKIAADAARRKFMPSYVVMNTKTMVDKKALQEYETKKTEGVPVTSLPEWDLQKALRGDGEGPLEKMIREAVEPFISHFKKTMQSKLSGEPMDDAENNIEFPAPKRTWVHQPAIEQFRNMLLDFAETLVPIKTKPPSSGAGTSKNGGGQGPKKRKVSQARNRRKRTKGICINTTNEVAEDKGAKQEMETNETSVNEGRDTAKVEYTGLDLNKLPCNTVNEEKNAVTFILIEDSEDEQHEKVMHTNQQDGDDRLGFHRTPTGASNFVHATRDENTLKNWYDNEQSTGSRKIYGAKTIGGSGDELCMNNNDGEVLCKTKEDISVNSDGEEFASGAATGLLKLFNSSKNAANTSQHADELHRIVSLNMGSAMPASAGGSENRMPPSWDRTPTPNSKRNKGHVASMTPGPIYDKS